ncbi:MAG: isoleucine--tRNA ligase, partial [Longimicrobiales bacterium]
MKYPEHPPTPTALEEQMLARWREEQLFRRTLDATAGEEEFVFYEGPPTANGRPGIHHVLSRTLKDVVCRFRTMQGRHVTRIAGWDTHGLPVEIEAEEKLGISGKRQIEEVGVARFNDVCRESVFTYKEEWEQLSERIGYWLDYSRPYITFAPDYIESVWWILKQLDRKGLIYRGHRSVAYCPRCGTALSSHEVAQGYADVEDPSVYFIVPVIEGNEAPASAPAAGEAWRRAFLVWTTTPWTIPANVALAVHPDLTYAEVAHEGKRYILAEPTVAAVFGEDAEIVDRPAASELVGLRYRRPFDLVGVDEADAARAWRVVAEEFVSAEEGTGLVHLAPAFGADDYAAGQRHELPMLRPIDDAGRFLESIPLVGGRFVKDADDALVDDLRARGLVFRYGREMHSYPHCWRCESPLIYLARDSWYVRTTARKDGMVANNREIAWHPPEVGTGRMGEWLEGNVDWALSRERYWGTPLPIWVCDADPGHREVIGSFDELAERVGGLPDGFDPHKPGIDALVWSCPSCGGVMRRTPEVIDVWFDSGSMPYAQWHYPFEHEAEFERHFPADFICEGVDQTRGWFYSLLAIATLLDRGPAYRNVIVNDLVLDAAGQKMSKSRGNAVDPWVAIGEHGADAIRWYFMTASQPWVPKRFDPEAVGESARRVFETLSNTYRFFALYASLEGWSAGAADPAPPDRPVMDRWVLARLDHVVDEARAALEAYDPTRAFRGVGDFIVDDLSNWYVRRSRDRFWGSDDEPTVRAAFRTLADALATVARLLAPVTPFLADWLYRAVSGGDSVHLARFPGSEAGRRNEALERGMAAARVLCRLGRAAREQTGIRVRQPLRTLYAVTPADVALDDELLDVVRAELNVKELHFLKRATELVRHRVEPNFRVLGPRLGPRMNAVAESVRALPAERVAELRAGRDIELEIGGERVVI